jgi:hypothetical protein
VAEQLVAANRHVEAEAHLALALDFLRAAGADRYVREAETIAPA